MPVSVHDELLLGHSLCRYMAIGISIMAVYILGFYSLLDMKYVTVKVTHPAHPNKTLWVSHLSSFYTDNKVVIDIPNPPLESYHPQQTSCRRHILS